MGEAVDRLLELAQARVKAHTRRTKSGKVVQVRSYDFNYEKRGPLLSAMPSFAPKVPTTEKELSKLQAEWADLDRELLPYAGRPRHPMAQRIMEKQKLIQKAIHHGNLDRGGKEGIGLPGGPRDVVIVGAGPAGLAASIYGGSEGLDTLLVDASDRVGGQAGYSSRIENLMGFPTGISGKELAETSLEQAQRVGAECKFGLRVESIAHDEQTGLKTLRMSDGSTIETRAVVIAGGVQFKEMHFPGSDAKGIVYGDSRAMKDFCLKGDSSQPAVIVGGANSAGQAAVDAAGSLPHVTLLIRGDDIRKGMSSYLVDQLESDPKVTIRYNSEVGSVDKDEQGRVKTVRLKDGHAITAGALGLFIGSVPNADWAGVATNEHGYVKTGQAGKPMETSIPGVFAAGDIRAENVTHRVAVASGEGAMTISYVHQYIPTVQKRPPLPLPADHVPNDAADHWQDAMHGLDAQQPDTGVSGVEERQKVSLSHGTAVTRLMRLTRSA